MIKRLLHRLLGYKVIISAGVCGESEHTAYLSKYCTVRVRWHGNRQLILNSDKTITGLPARLNATWKIK